MKKLLFLIFLFAALLIVSCSNNQSCDAGNELLCDFNKRGINENSTRIIVFKGTKINFDISRAGGVDYACGYVTAEFYDSEDKIKPNATLWIHCGGDDAGVYVEESKREIYDEEGNAIGLYRCTALTTYIWDVLEKKFKEHGDHL